MFRIRISEYVHIRVEADTENVENWWEHASAVFAVNTFSVFYIGYLEVAIKKKNVALDKVK